MEFHESETDEFSGFSVFETDVSGLWGVPTLSYPIIISCRTARSNGTCVPNDEAQSFPHTSRIHWRLNSDDVQAMQTHQRPRSVV